MEHKKAAREIAHRRILDVAPSGGNDEDCLHHNDQVGRKIDYLPLREGGGVGCLILSFSVSRGRCVATLAVVN
jgi:hypothetical protein